MNKYLIIAILVLLSAIGSLYYLYDSIKKELILQSQNNTTLMSGMKEYKFRDSLNISEVGKLKLDIDQLEQYRKKDLDLIKELKLKPTQIQTITTTVTQTKDSIIFKLQKDSCIHYDSKWLKVDGCIGGELYINSTDSTKTIAYKEYKHKFLWWKWGVKGFKQKIINFNPNSSIKYQEWVEFKD